MSYIEDGDMAKKHFEGTYFKCIANDGFSFALIQSVSSFSGPGLQLILENGSHEILQPDALRRVGDILHIEITQRNLFLSGTLAIKRKHPLSRPAMGPFRVFSMQCSHTVESMYHELWGEVNFNGTKHVFSPGRGYIEGDAGRSFPSQYFWYNAIGEDYGVTLAYATIPFGLIHFKGLLAFIMDGDREYRFCTYNGAKVVFVSKTQIVIAKGKYRLTAKWVPFEGHPLRAPRDGKMERTIQETLQIRSSVELRKGNEVIFAKENCHSSVEMMLGEDILQDGVPSES